MRMGLIITSSLTLLFISGCTIEESEAKISYAIVNETSTDLSIILNDRFDIDYSQSVSIETGDTVYFKTTIHFDLTEGLFNVSADSISILWQDRKYVSYVCKQNRCTGNRNIFLESNYLIKGETYYYNILESDYQDAIPLPN